MKKLNKLLLLFIFMCIPIFSSKIVSVGWYNAPALQDGDSIKTLGGYNYEYLKKIEHYTDWNYNFVFGTWKECEQMLIDGEIDIIGDVAITEERLEIYNYCEISNGSSNMLMVSAKDNDSLAFNDYESFDGLRVATIPSTFRRKLLDELSEKENFSVSYKEYPEHDEIFKAIDSEECDVAIFSNVNDFPKDKYKIISKFNPKPFYFIVNKEREDLLQDINNAIKQIKINNPYYDEQLFVKYFEDSSSSPIIAFTRDELEYLATDPIIEVLLNSNKTPYSFLDSLSGEPKGIIVDLFSLISRDTGLQFEFSFEDSYDKLLESIKNSKTDLIGGVVNDFAFAEQNDIILTQSYTTLLNGFAVDNDNMGIIKTVGVPLGEYISPKMQSEYEFIFYDNQKSCIDAVLEDEVDAAFLNSYFFEQQSTYPKYRDLSFNYNTQSKISIGISRKTNSRIYSILEKSIENINSKELDEIILKNTMIVEKLSFKNYLIRNIGFVVIIIALLIIMIISFSFLNYTNRMRLKHNNALEEKNTKLTDITTELKKALIKTKAADEAKTIFLLSMSHDLRTPMNTIMGMSDLALLNLDDKENVKDSLDTIKTASNYLLNIINDLLDMSSIEKGEINLRKKKFNLEKMVIEQVKQVQSMVDSKNLVLNYNIDVSNSFVIGDRVRLIRVLNNILTNAIKYTNEGEIYLSLKEKRIDEQNSIFSFIIKDSGIGMSDNQKSMIFERFYRVNTTLVYKTEGMGLGLSIAKGILNIMRATVNVESEIDKGTTFYIDIPFEIVKDHFIEKITEELITDLSSKKILLVEDNEINIKVFSKMLSVINVKFDIARNGEEAVQKFLEDESIDLLLMDIQMPIMNGYEATKIIRSINTTRAKNIPIIAVTANAFEKDIERVQKYGMNAHLSKPVNIKALVDLLSKYLM